MQKIGRFSKRGECYGGAKSGDFGQKALALMFKPQKGLWQLKRKRVYDTEG